MTTPFVSSLRTSMGASDAAATVSAPSRPSEGKAAVMSLFSALDLALDANGAVVAQSTGRSAAQELLASKSAEKQAEDALAASHARRRQQQRENEQKKQEQKPVTALSQALGLFDQELEERDAFVSRNKRRVKGKKPPRGGASAKGRRQRQEKYKRV